MEIDTATLRLAFMIIALTLLVLFYFATYRVTRSPYCGWWCVALAAFLSGSAAYLLDGTPHQWWANPAGSILLTFGATSSWAAARSLRTSSPPLWSLLTGPALVGAMAAADSPSTNDWSGGTWYLLMVATMFGMGAAELVRLGPRRPPATMAMIAAATLASGLYFFRLIAYLAVGPRDGFFTTYAGSEVTTLTNSVLLVTVSYSMTALSTDQTTTELRRRATHDGLTNLLNHTEFFSRAAAGMQQVQRTGTPGTLILADLDHFKRINDTHGHQAGDEVLKAFAAACLATVRSTDLVGRYGGEEYVLFLSGSTVDDAADIASSISRGLSAASGVRDLHPTASYGIAEVGPDMTLVELVAAADAALYRAKESGRDRYVVDGRPDRTSPT
ncbi:GGDEF domain-containing protein [Aeromicrobium sp. CF3.5]|uniref:GGDEF domain-containing protein n=1 Tax=Aeromicrobium sp. CF3.5 TaxID=3373078 RepID=UPI003EE585B0